MPGSRDSAPVADALKARFGAALEVEALPSSEALSRRYGNDEGGFVLVRPDGYIAFKATSDEGAQLDWYLRTTLAAAPLGS